MICLEYPVVFIYSIYIAIKMELKFKNHKQTWLQDCDNVKKDIQLQYYETSFQMTHSFFVLPISARQQLSALKLINLLGNLLI